jgi:hypothetical protein
MGSTITAMKSGTTISPRENCLFALFSRFEIEHQIDLKIWCVFFSDVSIFLPNAAPVLGISNPLDLAFFRILGCRTPFSRHSSPFIQDRVKARDTRGSNPEKQGVEHEVKHDSTKKTLGIGLLLSIS